MSSIRSDWTNLRQLTPAERRLLASAVVVLPAHTVLLRAFGLRRVQALGRRCSRRPRATADPSATTAAAVRMVALVAARLPGDRTCLARSVALWLLLRRRGIDTEVCIGVRAGGQPLDAHAWLEAEGRPINDAPDIADRFARLDPRHPPA